MSAFGLDPPPPKRQQCQHIGSDPTPPKQTDVILECSLTAVSPQNKVDFGRYFFLHTVIRTHFIFESEFYQNL